MGFDRFYTRWIGTDTTSEYNSIMTVFFGFSVSTEDDTRLRNSFGGSTYIKYEGNGRFVEKASPIGSYYTEKTGTHTLRLERPNEPTSTEKEFENRFFDAMGNYFTPSNWVWKPMYIPYSAADIYEGEKKKSIWPKVISCLVMSAVLAVCTWFLVGAVATISSTDSVNIVDILILIGTALGILFAYPLGYGAGLLLDFSPSLARCGQETQIEYGQKFFARIDELFPYNSKAANVLKEYAIYLKRVHPKTPIAKVTAEASSKYKQDRSATWAAEKKRKWIHGVVSILLLLAVLGALLLTFYQKADFLCAAEPTLQEVVEKYRQTDPDNLQASPVYNLLLLGGLFSLSALVIWIALFFDIDTSTFWGKVFVGVGIFGALMLIVCSMMMYHLGRAWVFLPAAVLAVLLSHKMMLTDD